MIIDKKSPQVMTALEIFNSSFPELEFLIPGFIPAQGLTLLVGPVKVGKSWFILFTCLVLSIGGNVLGNIQVEQRNGIYLALEDTARRLKMRLKKLQMEINENISFILNAYIGQAGLEYLRALLESRPNISYIVIDTLGRFSQGKGKSNFQDDYDWLAEIKDLADEKGIAIIVIHHTRKMKDGIDEFNEISGSTGLIAVADSLILLKRSRHSNLGELTCTGRDFEEKKLSVEFSPETCRWSIKGRAENVASSPERQIILDSLRKYGEMAPKDLSLRLNKSAKLIANILLKMREEGLVTRGSRSTLWKAYTPQDFSSTSCISSPNVKDPFQPILRKEI